MDRAATSKVETTHQCGPTVGVPGPAGDGVVDNGFPYEHEDHHWTELATFGNGTSCDDNAREVLGLGKILLGDEENWDIRDRGEHELVYAVDDGRKAWRALNGSIESILQPKVHCAKE